MSGYGWVDQSSGSWDWVPMSGGAVPSGAVHAGQDQDGGTIYVGRAFYNCEIIPAKVCPAHGCAFLSYNGDEISTNNYEVLVSDRVAWRSSRDGEIPIEAIKVGQTSDGEPLFVGRALHDGTLTPGKVHPSHRCLYIPYAGGEVQVNEYDIMISRS